MEVPILIRIYYAAIIVIATVIAITGITNLQYQLHANQELTEIRLILNDLYPYED